MCHRVGIGRALRLRRLDAGDDIQYEAGRFGPLTSIAGGFPAFDVQVSRRRSRAKRSSRPSVLGTKDTAMSGIQDIATSGKHASTICRYPSTTHTGFLSTTSGNENAKTPQQNDGSHPPGARAPTRAAGTMAPRSGELREEWRRARNSK